MIHPVILSGGSGTRLWPLSRRHYPKQFLPLLTKRTMLQETVARLEGLAGVGSPIIVCNEDHRFMAAEQMREEGFQPRAILLEPAARNTAPAVALAALSLANPEDCLLVLAADHSIRDVPAFHAAIQIAVAAAESGSMVTFGIVAQRPETGYGYIKRGKELMPGGATFDVEAFVEKPDSPTAQAYVESGSYYWNSGMFVFKASRYLEELEKFNPEILAACRRAISNAQHDLDFLRVDKKAFAECPSDSIDYAVMEKTDSAVVVPLDAGWSDVGSWSSLWEVSEKDSQQNTIQGDVLTHDTTGCYLHSERKLVATVGVRDMVVVETDDAVMVAPKDRVQEVNAIVEQLRTEGRSESEIHRQVYRPWGYYDCIDRGDRHQTKRIVVNPGQKLSLQMHHHRAEHWIVVKGTAKVTRGDETFELSESESTYIPIGTVHRLENLGVSPLEVVEVQSGSYLGEDDIIRLEDNYGRVYIDNMENRVCFAVNRSGKGSRSMFE